MQFKVAGVVPTEVGIHSYIFSPTVLAFFEGPQWDSKVGIHFYAGQIKINWHAPM